VLQRGQIIYIPGIHLPRRFPPWGTTPVKKYVLILQDERYVDGPDAAFLVLSSVKSGRELAPYEVFVPADQNQNRPLDALVDCRWPYTAVREEITRQGTRAAGYLNHARMEEIYAAMVVGLQMEW
jgi:hypothetical protein